MLSNHYYPKKFRHPQGCATICILHFDDIYWSLSALFIVLINFWSQPSESPPFLDFWLVSRFRTLTDKPAGWFTSHNVDTVTMIPSVLFWLKPCWETHINWGIISFICTDIDECASDPCQNSGTCTDSANGYSCVCADGYEGTVCETGM